MALLTEPNVPLKREDISDEMIIVDMQATPFTTMVKKGTAPDNSLFEYPVDKYDAPKLGGRPDGKDVQSGELTNGMESVTKLGARIQWFHRAVGVGKIANTVPNVAGVGKGKIFSRAVIKKTKELKRDIEFNFLSLNESAADNGTDGSITRGVGRWIQSGAQSDQPVPAAYRPAAAQIVQLPNAGGAAGFTEKMLTNLLEAIFNITGEKSTMHCFCRTVLQAVVTDFTLNQPGTSTSIPVRRFNQSGTDGKIELVVDRYVGNFGTVIFLPDLFLNDTNALRQLGYFTHMERWHTRPQQAPQYEELPNGGGGRKAQVDAITALACDNPLAEAKIEILAP